MFLLCLTFISMALSSSEIYTPPSPCQKQTAPVTSLTDFNATLKDISNNYNNTEGNNTLTFQLYISFDYVEANNVSIKYLFDEAFEKALEQVCSSDISHLHISEYILLPKDLRVGANFSNPENEGNEANADKKETSDSKETTESEETHDSKDEKEENPEPGVETEENNDSQRPPTTPKEPPKVSEEPVVTIEEKVLEITETLRKSRDPKHHRLAIRIKTLLSRAKAVTGLQSFGEYDINASVRENFERLIQRLSKDEKHAPVFAKESAVRKEIFSVIGILEAMGV